MLVRQPFQAYAESYTGTEFHAPNHLLTGGEVRAPERGELQSWQEADIKRLAQLGII